MAQIVLHSYPKCLSLSIERYLSLSLNKECIYYRCDLLVTIQGRGQSEWTLNHYRKRSESYCRKKTRSFWLTIISGIKLRILLIFLEILLP
jgi:hypothetical protein